MTRERILERAEELFTTKGIQDTSIGDVAAAAGISKGTLFYHFRSKDELIMEIAFAHIQKVSDDILGFIERGEEGLGLREVLERFLGRLLDEALRNRLHLYLIEESACRNERLKAAMRGKYREWQLTLIEAIRPFMGGQAPVMGPILLAFADGLVIQASLGVEFPPVADMLGALGFSGRGAGAPAV